MKIYTLIISAFILLNAGNILAQDSRQDDSLALVSLYNSTEGSKWTIKDGWLTNSPINNWYGITIRNGRVTEVTLDFNNLSGNIPNEIINLTKLEILSLRSNNLMGAIPAEFGNLTQLVEIGFTNNKLSGEIPKSFYKLVNLQYLALGFNQLSGSIPVELCQLVSLRIMYIHTNKLSGSLPSEIGNLINLEILELGANQLTGAIPSEIGNLINLYMLKLSDNLLSETIPPEIGNFEKIEYLWLQNNQLTGSIPTELGNLINIRNLNLSLNQLSGTIPIELGYLTTLDTLFIRNNQLTGSIPKEFGYLKDLKSLSVRDNYLTGSIPVELSKLTNITEFRCSNNSLTGGVANIPKNNMDICWLFGNKFDFDELENKIDAKDYQYAPQDTLGSYEGIEVPEGETVTLEATEAGLSSNIRFQWFKDGIEIPNIRSRKLIIAKFKKMHEGDYTFFATDSLVPNLTINMFPFRLKIQGTTDVVIDDYSKNITLQPNPANDIITLNIGNDIVGLTNIAIYDALGNIQTTINPYSSGDTYPISIQNFEPGVYSAVISYLDGKTLSRKFMVVR